MATFKGNCHCRASSYEFTLDEPLEKTTLLKCNCSNCRRRQTLWALVPLEKFTYEQGEDKLKLYQWGKKHMAYYFCPNCGVSVTYKHLVDPHPMLQGKIGVNMWTVDDVDPLKCTIYSFDGKNELPGPHEEDASKYP